MSALLALTLLWSAGFQRAVTGPPVVGDRIEPFQLAARDGPVYSWAPKRTTVMTFCAFWCDTWKDQLPRVRESQRDVKGLPVDFLTISVDGRWSERGIAAAVGTNLSDRGNQWCSKIGIDRVPYILVVDPSGTVRWASYGVVRSGDLTAACRNAQARKEGGTVYLTFDDFPAPKLNDELLDALRAAGVPATFFCICSRLDEQAAVVRRAVREGHELDVHAWIHDEKKTDIPRCRAALQKYGAAGALCRLAGSESVLDSISMARVKHPVADPYDYQRPGVDELVRRISSQVRDGSIIQLHAGAADTVAALSKIVEKLRVRGFNFARLSGE